MFLLWFIFIFYLFLVPRALGYLFDLPVLFKEEEGNRPICDLKHHTVLLTQHIGSFRFITNTSKAVFNKVPRDRKKCIQEYSCSLNTTFKWKCLLLTCRGTRLFSLRDPGADCSDTCESPAHVQLAPKPDPCVALYVSIEAFHLAQRHNVTVAE